jgi:hypothetical protein
MADQSFAELLSVVCGRLEALHIRYAITGSVASSIYGEPHQSQDIDICLAMSEQQARTLAATLPARFYRSVEAMVDAVRRRSMANIIDSDTGLKVDLCVLPDEPYYQSVFARIGKIEIAPGGPSFWLVSAEDVILMKLVWRKDSRSQKQWENALSVVRCRGAQLDWSYLRKWAEQLGLPSDLEALASEGGV